MVGEGKRGKDTHFVSAVGRMIHFSSKGGKRRGRQNRHTSEGREERSFFARRLTIFHSFMEEGGEKKSGGKQNFL